ncbi:MAG: peptidase M23 [Flavobacteriales bacterium]|nr:peptidase M23 [Flavobacteriales bacterium]
MNSKWPYLKLFRRFFFKRYEISSVDESSLNQNLIGGFKGYQLFVYSVYLIFVLVVLIFLLTAFGPLQYLLPKSSYYKKSELIELILKVDSLEYDLAQKSQYMIIIDKILAGEIVDSLVMLENDSSIVFQNLDFSPSKEDSTLRQLVESEDLYNIPVSYKASRSSLEDFVFFKPVDGIITSYFNLSENHFGVDVVTNTNSSVKATLDGVVIFADWSVAGGHTVLIQHPENIVSVYMHNSFITKSTNELVKAGEVIGIVGNSGELSSGPHLHFELWQNGSPINPVEYIDF